MTNPLLQEMHSKEIGGRNFQVGLLPYAKAMPAYHRVAKLLAGDDSVLASANIGMFMFASSFADAVSEADMKFFVELFGAVSQVEIGPNQTIQLTNDANRTAAFAGRIEDLFEWLDFACEVNFKGVAEKLRAARVALEKQAEVMLAAKAQPNS